jgi:hypothetical protein
MGFELTEDKVLEFCAKRLKEIKNVSAFAGKDIVALRTKPNLYESQDIARYINGVFYFKQPLEAYNTLLPLTRHIRSSDLKKLAQFMFSKWAKCRRGAWILPLVAAYGDTDTVAALIREVFAALKQNGQSTRFIIEGLGLSGKKPVLVFYNTLLNDESLKKYHTAAETGKKNFAAVTGYTLEDMTDMLTPDFDLEDNSAKSFEYDNNIVTVSITNALKLSVKDELGASYEKFDFLASRFLTRYIAALSNAVEKTAKRFSDAIINRRRWQSGVFLNNVLEHPVLKKFAHNLVWGVFNESNKLKSIFLCFDDGIKNLNLERVELNKNDLVGLLNPIDADKNTLQILNTNFKIALKQTSRGIYGVYDYEIGQNAVNRFASNLIDYSLFYEGLSQKDYIAGAKEPNGLCTFYRPCKALNLMVKIIFTPFDKRKPIKNTRIAKILFFHLDKIKKKNGKYFSDKSIPLSLEKVDKYLFSDVLNDIYGLTAN